MKRAYQEFKLTYKIPQKLLLERFDCRKPKHGMFFLSRLQH